MAVVNTEILRLRSSEDIVLVRRAVRNRLMEFGFSLVDQTKMVTAASELARNAVDYAGGGEAHIELHNESDGRRGVRVIFVDHGPGIPDIGLALKDGFTTGNGLGLGLGGARRLVNEFDISSRVGEGTRVTITRWK